MPLRLYKVLKKWIKTIGVISKFFGTTLKFYYSLSLAKYYSYFNTDFYNKVMWRKSMTIIECIEQLNAERGWSLYELSKRADIAEATVYTWKRKNKSPSMSVLEKVCNSYGITLYQFFNGFHDPELTEEQNHLIAQWSNLEPEERDVIKQLINVLINKR